MTKISGKTAIFTIAAALCVVGLLVFLVNLQASDRVSDADIADVTAAVTDVTDMSKMIEGDNSMVKRLYGLDPNEYEGVVLYYPNSAGVANELFIVKLSSTAQQDAVKAAVDARLATETTAFNGYGVGQYEMLQESVIDVSGNYIMFVVSQNPKEADAAFQGALRSGENKWPSVPSYSYSGFSR